MSKSYLASPKIGAIYSHGEGGGEVSAIRLMTMLETWMHGMQIPRILLRENCKLHPKDWHYLGYTEVKDPSDYERTRDYLSQFDILFTGGFTNIRQMKQYQDPDHIPFLTALLLDYKGIIVSYYGWKNETTCEWGQVGAARANGIVSSRQSQLDLFKQTMDESPINYTAQTHLALYPLPFGAKMKMLSSKQFHSMDHRDVIFNARLDGGKGFRLLAEAMEKSRILCSHRRLRLPGAVNTIRGSINLDHVKKVAGDILSDKFPIGKGYHHTQETLDNIMDGCMFSCNLTHSSREQGSSNKADTMKVHGFQNTEFEAIQRGLLPIVSQGWDPLNGNGMIEVPEEISGCSQINSASNIKAMRYFLDTMVFTMTYEEYRMRMEGLQVYMNKHHNPGKIIPSLYKFIEKVFVA